MQYWRRTKPVAEPAVSRVYETPLVRELLACRTMHEFGELLLWRRTRSFPRTSLAIFDEQPMLTIYCSSPSPLAPSCESPCPSEDTSRTHSLSAFSLSSTLPQQQKGTMSTTLSSAKTNQVYQRPYVDFERWPIGCPIYAYPSQFCCWRYRPTKVSISPYTFHDIPIFNQYRTL